MGALIRSGSRQTAVEQQAVVQGRQYLTFMVAGESFGIAISSVKEIIEYRAPTEVPMLPAYLRGIVNLRGRVLPVIDLVARFGRGKVQPARRTCIVILEVQQNDEQHDIGVVVDAVSAVVEIADVDIEPAPSFGANLRADFISGMGKVGEQFVILLDIGKVLSIEELALLGAVGESEAPPSETRSTYPAALQAGEAAASR
jgi:purine-binding chemotaxis protein CheW